MSAKAPGRTVLRAGRVQVDVTASAMPGHVLMGCDGEVYAMTPEEASEIAASLIDAANKAREAQAKAVLAGRPATVLP